jgi:vacuolar iron transporter family protein
METRDVNADVVRWRENLQGETDGIAVYRAMAAAESERALATVYGRLADAETRHAAVWEAKLREAKAWSTTPSPSWRARLLSFLARRGAVALVAQTMAGAEARDRAMYDDQPEAGVDLPREERSHARLLREIDGATGSVIARLEGRHRMGGGNALRAAVLGVNDGLVSNFSLVMGVTGAGGDAHAVIVAGAAGLLAGSLSMALGEWLSVQSARELYAHQIAVEREELEVAPDEEEEELALIYRSKGAGEDQARTMARQIVRGDARAALDALVREELAIDPGELGGSAYVAAGTSFAMFALGAIVPLVPHLVAAGAAAAVASAVLSGVALFGIGAMITVITGQPALRAGARQLAIGIAAAAVTYGLGRLFGAAIS